MTAEPVNNLLTPPPDADHIRNSLKHMDTDPLSYSALEKHDPVHGSAEDGDSHTPTSQDEDPLDRQHKILDEDTTTTTTTTTTTSKVPKGLRGGLDNVVAHHQSLHQKYQPSPPSDGNGSEIEEDRQRASSAAAAVKLQEESSTSQHSDIIKIRAPSTSTSASFKTLSAQPSGPCLPSKAVTTAQTPSPLAQQHRLQEIRTPLHTSSSTTSLVSTTSSSGSGTPSSTDGYHTIATISTTTTRKRKVRRPTFEARSSRLDPEELSRSQDPFRGFHTLFWIVMGAYGLITFDEEWTRVGKAFGGTFFSSFSQDAIMLAVSDIGLVLSTGLAFLLIKVIAKGWMRYKVTGMVVQHCVQVLFLLLATAWTIWRDWPWLQSGFFTLHAIAMLMKIHSYIAYNGELSEKLIQLRKSEAAYAQLKKDDSKTADDAQDDAASSTSSTSANNSNSNSNNPTTSSDDSSLDSDSQDSQSPDQNESISRRHHRRASEAATALLQDHTGSPAAVNAGILAADIEELKGDLRCQNGELWPANVTIANFVDYLIVPSLIYELQYPRTNKIRPLYVFEKSVATLGTFTLLYLTTEHYIYPVVFNPAISPLRALVLLLIPFMLNYLMIFYIIFECICNAFAELSCFADRNFYEDWWNCVSFDEWARKWNKPVHHFLLRHVYDSSIESFHLSKSKAAIATFFLSSCVHELVMMVVTRKVRLYLFALQMFQLPLMWMGNHKSIRDKPRLGNALFWLAMFCGPPLLGVAYCYA
ncbi:hypothetical protein BGZ67_004828 [Mortierella alpina]|nr:hypothetical protein BGZ67_004828 [Mortierella alpina]